MSQVLNPNSLAGSRNENEPRLIGNIIKEMFRGDSPLAENRRAYLVSKENAEKGGMKHE